MNTMTYERYRAWILNRDYYGQFWWVPDNCVKVPNSSGYYHNFRYRLTPGFNDEGRKNGQYIGVRENGVVEIGEFVCNSTIGNMYYSSGTIVYLQCNFENTKLIRIAHKDYGCHQDAISALMQKETLVGNIFDKGPLCTDEGLYYYPPTVSSYHE